MKVCESCLLISFYSEGVELVVPSGPIRSIFSPVIVSSAVYLEIVINMGGDCSAIGEFERSPDPNEFAL